MGGGATAENLPARKSTPSTNKKQNQKREKKKKKKNPKEEKRAKRENKGLHICRKTQELAPHGRRIPRLQEPKLYRPLLQKNAKFYQKLDQMSIQRPILERLYRRHDRQIYLAGRFYEGLSDPGDPN